MLSGLVVALSSGCDHSEPLRLVLLPNDKIEAVYLGGVGPCQGTLYQLPLWSDSYGCCDTLTTVVAGDTIPFVLCMHMTDVNPFGRFLSPSCTDKRLENVNIYIRAKTTQIYSIVRSYQEILARDKWIVYADWRNRKDKYDSYEIARYHGAKLSLDVDECLPPDSGYKELMISSDLSDTPLHM